MMIRTTALAALAALILAAPVAANDTSAELAAGGLVFTKNAAIQMRSEDLYLSTELVRVNYRFLNTSAKDVTVRVAFPMPDVTQTYSPLAIPTEDPVNLLAFATTVDGKPVQAAVEQKAVFKGVDHTDLLRRMGVPLAPHLRGTDAALDRLTPAQQKLLLAAKLVHVDEYDAGKGMERHLSPDWTLKTTFHWQQTFPAGREVRIEHRYKPATGASAGTMVGTPDFRTSADGRAMRAKYCIDEAFLAAVKKTQAPGEDWPRLMEYRIAYILKTGANWAGPIGDFHLTVDKGQADNLVSFCGTGVTKTSPTTFEMRKANFTPTKDLDILVLRGWSSE